MVLATDFDRVIHDIDHPIPGRKMGPPIEGAAEHMQTLKQAGHTLIIHTLWATTETGKKACEKWLEYWGVPFDEVTNIKPKADLYIDDRGLRFTTWPETYAAITSLPPGH